MQASIIFVILSVFAQLSIQQDPTPGPEGPNQRFLLSRISHRAIPVSQYTMGVPPMGYNTMGMPGMSPYSPLGPIGAMGPYSTMPFSPLNPMNPMASLNPLNPMAPLNPLNPMAPMNPLNPMAPLNPMGMGMGPYGMGIGQPNAYGMPYAF